VTPDNVLCLLSILLIPLAFAGMCLINTGLNRSRSAAHIMLSSLCAIAVAALVYVVLGCSLVGASGQAAHAIVISGKNWDWLGAGRLFARSVTFDENTYDHTRGGLLFLFQLSGVCLAALIPVGSGAERWKLSAICASTAALAGFTYPLFAHWAWGGGWLAQLGEHYHLGRGFVDAGGAGCIQTAGGLSALATAWILGARHGKFTPEGIPTAMPGHNAVLVLSGCTLALAGWTGLNTAGALLAVAGTGLGPAVLAAVNTLLCAACGALAALLTTRIRFGKPDASLTANGWVAGLVSSSASAAFLKPASAMLIGLVIGAAVVFAIEIVETKMHVDDPVGAIAVHAVGGIWGLLALGMFADLGGASGQFLAQLVGVATLLGFVLPFSYGANLLINRFLPQRVAPGAERQGMDLFELGAGAYPEFVTHRDDFLRR
jgi:ammonium transporter, Amt family